MGKRQVVEIDVTWDNNYSEIKATDVMKLLITIGSVKSISIKTVNKRKEATDV